METEVKIPAVGESITSGVLVSWEKKDGEWVNAGEVLFTFETDKVSTEITAPQSGILRIRVPDGSEVKVGEVVAVVEARVQEAASPEVQASASEQKGEVKDEGEGPTEAAEEESPRFSTVSDFRASVGEGKERLEIPEFGLHPVTAREERVSRKRLSPLRRKVATQLVTAQQTAAMLTTFNECDMGAVLQTRGRLQETFQKRHGVKLGLMSIFMKASVAALKAVPQINARIEGDDLVENHYYDIGVAVGTERGLMVPVVRDADQKSFAEIERDILEFSKKAREAKIKIEELQGGVFTISNGGIYGSLLSTPILNAPQSGILGLHKIQERPVALKGEILIRPMMYLALSYDHRVVDGREAVTFLIKIKEAIEDPVRLLLEI